MSLSRSARAASWMIAAGVLLTGCAQTVSGTAEVGAPPPGATSSDGTGSDTGSGNTGGAATAPEGSGGTGADATGTASEGAGADAAGTASEGTAVTGTATPTTGSTGAGATDPGTTNDPPSPTPGVTPPSPTSTSQTATVRQPTPATTAVPTKSVERGTQLSAAEMKEWSRQATAAEQALTSLSGTLEQKNGAQTTGGTVQRKLDKGRIVASDYRSEIAGVGARTVQVDGKVFMTGDGPLLAELKLPAGKTWAQLRRESKNTVVAQLAESVLPTFELNESDTFLLPQEVPAKVERVGTEEISGQQTTHYRETADLKLIEQASGSSGLEQVNGITSLVIDFWMLPDHRWLRTTQTTTLTGGQQSSFTFTVDAFNPPVSITAPPAAAVYSD